MTNSSRCCSSGGRLIFDFADLSATAHQCSRVEQPQLPADKTHAQQHQDALQTEGPHHQVDQRIDPGPATAADHTTTAGIVDIFARSAAFPLHLSAPVVRARTVPDYAISPARSGVSRHISFRNGLVIEPEQEQLVTDCEHHCANEQTDDARQDHAADGT